MPTFLSKYMHHTSIYESPGSFWKWSAYAAIAAVLRDNCYLGQGDGRMFPNIYVLFLAESGGRKGKPIDMAEGFVLKCNNTKIISGRASIQAIMDEISRSETDKKTGKLVKPNGSAIFFAQELSAGIVADPEAINILTDIYDYKSNPYKSRLRTGPCFNLERIVFSMLTGSNEDMMKGLFDERAKKGGMLARTFLIIPNEMRPPNSLMDVDMDERVKSYANTFGSFRELLSLGPGNFVLEKAAKEEFTNWYNPFYVSYQKKKESTGVVARIHTGVLKLAMILAANDMTLHITKFHIEEAITECLSLLPNYQAYIMSTGKSTINEAGEIFLTELLSAKDHIVTRKFILRNHWRDFDGDTFDKLVVTLEQAGIVRSLQNGNELSYQLTESAIAAQSQSGK